MTDHSVSPSATKFVFRLAHDFNQGVNEGGFHEVVLPAHLEGQFHRGDEVILTDEGMDDFRGRIRCVVIVVEEAQPSGSAE